MSAGERLPGTPVPMHTWPGADGLTIAGDAWGPKSGRLVMLLHGGGQTRHAWKGAGETLAAAGYRAIAFDARGHGDSGWAERAEDYIADKMVEDLKAVIAAEGGEKPALVGASMGAGTSLLAVGEGRIDASALVLVDMAPKVEPEGVAKIQAFMNQKPEGFDSLEEVAEAIANYQPHRKRPRNLDGLAKNVRKGAERQICLALGPEAAPGAVERPRHPRLPATAFRRRRQSETSDAAGPRRPLRRIERGRGPVVPEAVPACGVCQRQGCRPYGGRRPQRHLRGLRRRVPEARRAAAVNWTPARYRLSQGA